MKKMFFLLLGFILFFSSTNAQLKYIVEDFEGFAQNQSKLDKEGLFTYGNLNFLVTTDKSKHFGYSGDKALLTKVGGKESFGGWGKGLTASVELEQNNDFFNLYILNTGSATQLKLIVQDDDNSDSKFTEESDDVWEYSFIANSGNDWQLISMPLRKFLDANKGGDAAFNINYKQGKLLTIIITSAEEQKASLPANLYFDFLCFSKGSLPTGATVFEPKKSSLNSYCKLGAWSEEGNQAKFLQIASSFESQFNTKERKLDVVHFFYPFSAEKGEVKELYPAIDKINEVINNGYTPMITLENHYLKVNKRQGQPNLYSIIEGHFDYFFAEWARRAKTANGEIMLRILHEFNGNWYPWSISDNDKNPAVYVKAYKRIHDIFKKEGANNVKFIWCPNSMSVPQESWNYIMDAYPGDAYVDFVGIDVYNGAGEQGTPVWRSFRKEAIETYFLLTDKLPNKPLLICEAASRERNSLESNELQSKAEWITQMSEALKSDMSKVRLLVWFNEYEQFKISSSDKSKRAFVESIWNDPYFNKKELSQRKSH